MGDYSDTVNEVKFDEALSDDEKAYMVFEEDNSFYTMELSGYGELSAKPIEGL